MNRRICVIFNPTAKGERALRMRRYLDSIGKQCVLKPTPAAGAGRVLAAQSVDEGFESIVAAGGDGTVNEVLNGIGDVPHGFERARLGVLPLGTVNVYALEHRLPQSLPEAWEVICSGQERLIDLPYAEFEADGARIKRYFAQLAGAGFDARATEMVNWSLKKMAGYAAYVVAVGKALWQAKNRFTVSIGSDHIAGELVVFGNGRYFGGSHTVFPDASLRDGKLDVCIFSRVNWMTALETCWRLVWRKIPVVKATHYLQAEKVQVASQSRTPVQLDGEPVGVAPATFAVEPSRLRILAG